MAIKTRVGADHGLHHSWLGKPIVRATVDTANRPVQRSAVGRAILPALRRRALSFSIARTALSRNPFNIRGK
jgi:hypothetical protein